MPKILVTGCTGQVGSELKVLSENYPEFIFLFTDRSQLDLTIPDSIFDFFSKEKVKYCINTAAYTQVDRAEEEASWAKTVNVDGVNTLGRACSQYGTVLIHLSTDYVYASDLNRPLKEGDPTDPQNIYGKTKLAGEKCALQENERTIIIRTSWVYSSFGKNFVKTMLKLSEERNRLKVVYDQIGTPTYAFDLARTLLEIISFFEKREIEWKSFPRTFNYSNEGIASWFDFCKSIFEFKKINCSVEPIESVEFPTAASRPHYSVLDKSLIKQVFGIEIPYWRDSLKNCLEKLPK